MFMGMENFNYRVVFLAVSILWAGMFRFLSSEGLGIPGFNNGTYPTCLHLTPMLGEVVRVGHSQLGGLPLELSRL